MGWHCQDKLRKCSSNTKKIGITLLFCAIADSWDINIAFYDFLNLK